MRIPPLFLLGLTLAIACTETRAEPLNLEHHPGKAIYAKLCVDCHGAHGEGVKDKADDPLQGSRTLDDLAGRIERTMPEDEEHLCVGEDAKAVAAYVYDAFYSVEARARNTPARIDLSRLTVPQYRNSIADLIIAFRGEVNVGEDRGIKGQYFGDRGFNERKEFREQKKPDRYERVDDAIRFDYGEGVPNHEEAKEFTPENFSRFCHRKPESTNLLSAPGTAQLSG
jgi:cytochrome c5